MVVFEVMSKDNWLPFVKKSQGFEDAGPYGRQRQHRAKREYLSADEIRQFSVYRPSTVVRDLMVHWGVIVFCWFVIQLHALLIPVAIGIIGSQIYALTIIGHDAVHKRLFRNKDVNNLVSDLFVYAPLGLITRVNGENHLKHHELLGTTLDPDRWKYTSEGRESRSGLFLSFLPNKVAHAQAKSVLRDNSLIDDTQSRNSRYSLRDLVVLATIQLVMISSLTLLHGWWGWLTLWVLPAGLFMVGGDSFRSFCEHSAVLGDDETNELSLLTSFREPSLLERIFIAPHNMNNHATHHLYVSIPYFNLPMAERLIRQRDPGNKIRWKTSYLSHCRDFISHRPWKAT